ncbi:hypothetical protein HII36_08240 [Nonomuraea sp. NN258]|uniref:DUF6461 domain-containing protein n=1 Tax=Nonomuraea antri TaxID=2730852 RepID=UPI00156A22FF|nr:DUF6461 domain-containing protein [Nonomuraea antri]NRQ31828.1 hypothetical protein [Nonomuraea antri]
MRPEDFVYYQELVSAWFADPTCLTWSAPTDLDDVARAFGADPAAGERMNVEDAQIEQYNADIPGILPTLVAGTCGGWALVVEPNGCEGARPEVLRALSVRGRAVSVLLGGGRGDLLSYAAGGEVVAVRTTAVPFTGPGLLPGDADAIIDAVPAEPAEVEDPVTSRAAVLLAAERITGVRLTEAWLLDDGLTRLLVADPLPDDLVPERHHDHHVLADPELRTDSG